MTDDARDTSDDTYTGATGSPVDDLLEAIATTPTGTDLFVAMAPDWFGERVFGGMVVAQAVHAALQTVESQLTLHSAHAAFVGALRPGPVDLAVEHVRDGRTFTTRHVVSSQNSRDAVRLTASFHGDETGDEYQIAMPSNLPEPESLPPAEAPPPFDVREIGPTPRRADGTYRSTRRAWIRTITALPDDATAHVGVAAFLSDMTGTSFRPLNLGEWATHTDASIDHAVWFHRPCRFDDWIYTDFHALVNSAGRSTVRGEFYDRDGRLCMSMAQELLIRPLG